LSDDANDPPKATMCGRKLEKGYGSRPVIKTAAFDTKRLCHRLAACSATRLPRWKY